MFYIIDCLQFKLHVHAKIIYKTNQFVYMIPVLHFITPRNYKKVKDDCEYTVRCLLSCVAVRQFDMFTY